MLNNLFFFHRTFFFESLANDIAHHAWFVAPFSERIEPAAHEHEAGVLYKFIVSSGNMSFFRKELTDSFGYLREMHRCAMTLDSEIRIIANALNTDSRSSGATPLSKRIAANVFRKREPTFQNLFVLVGIIHILEFIEETVEKISFRDDFFVRK